MDRQFSIENIGGDLTEVLGEVEAGSSAVLTEKGRPVALVTPVTAGVAENAASRRVEIEAFHAAWTSRDLVVIGPWTREELYER